MAKKLAILGEALDEIQSKADKVKSTVNSIKLADEDKESAALNSPDSLTHILGSSISAVLAAIHDIPTFLKNYLSGKKIREYSMEAEIKRLEKAVDLIQRVKPKLEKEIGKDPADEFFFSARGLVPILNRVIHTYKAEGEDEAKKEFMLLPHSIFSLLKSMQHIYKSLNDMEKSPRLKVLIDLLLKEYGLSAGFDTHGRPIHDYKAPHRGDALHTPETRYEQRVEA